MSILKRLRAASAPRQSLHVRYLEVTKQIYKEIEDELEKQGVNVSRAIYRLGEMYYFFDFQGHSGQIALYVSPKSQVSVSVTGHIDMGVEFGGKHEFDKYLLSSSSGSSSFGTADIASRLKNYAILKVIKNKKL